MVATHSEKASVLRVIETPVCEVLLDFKDVVITRYKHDVLVTLDEIKMVEVALNEITQGRPFKTILDGRGGYTPFEADARRYAASSPITKKIVVSAFVVNTLPSKLMVNFYLKFNKPKYRIKVFSDYEIAYNWLINFKG
jgi:hypothetical protein